MSSGGCVVLELPEYLTAQQVAERAGVHYDTFRRHVRENVGGLRDARKRVPRVRGYLWEARALRKYLGMMAAAYGTRERGQG